MRLTEFWYRMGEQFGPTYAESLARDYVIAGLGSRTVTRLSLTARTPRASGGRYATSSSFPARSR